MDNRLDLITIRSYDNYFSAHIGLTRLESEGVSGFLRDEQTVTIDPILTNAIGGIKLQVRREDAEDALRILEAIDQDKKCPQCQSAGFIQVPKRSVANWVTGILTWLGGSLAIAPDQVYRCDRCGYEEDI